MCTRVVLIAAASSLPFAGGAEVEVAVALDCRSVHGHSPVWDAALKRLHFVDIEGQKVVSYDPASSDHQEVDMLEQVGCIVPYVQNRLLVAGQERVFQLGFQGKRGRMRRLPGHLSMVPITECEPEVLNPDETGYRAPPGARFHSGACDAQVCYKNEYYHYVCMNILCMNTIFE